MSVKIYQGDILYASSAEKLNVFEKSYIVVENGVVEGIYPVIPENY